MPFLEQQKKLHKNVRGPSVKQFEWFQMQTRLRKIIQQIIDPIQDEIIKNSSHIEKLEKNNVGFNQKIQYILKMTTNDPQVFERGVFRKIQEKFEKQQNTLTFLQQKVKNNTNFIENKITLIDERMKESNDMISQIQQLKASNRQNLKNQTQKFDTIRKNIEQNVQAMSLAIQQNQKSSRQKLESLQKQISLGEMKMQNIFKQFAKVKEYFEGQKSINDNLIAEQIKLKEENKVLEGKIGEINKKIKQLSKIKPFLQDIQVDCKKVLFKIDNIIPLITQSQINECLYRILPQKFHPRVAVYEFQKYKDLNEKVLNRKFDTQPLEVDFNGQQLIRQAQQRNTKLITKLKLKYYKNNGVELDFISFQQRQKLMNNFDYQKLTEIIDQLQEFQNQQNHNKKNMRLTQDDVINIVHKQLQIQKNLLIEKIQTQIQHSKIDIKSTTEVINNTVDKLQNKLQRLSEKFNQNKNDIDLTMKNIQRTLADIGFYDTQYVGRMNSLHLFGKQIQNCLELIFTCFKKMIPNLQQNNLHVNNGNFHINFKNIKKHPKYHSEYKETKLQYQSDSEQHQQLKDKIQQHSEQFSITQFYDKFRILLQSMKKHLQGYQVPESNMKNINNHKNKSSYSKLTKAQQSMSNFKSHLSFDPLNKERNKNSFEKSNEALNKRQVSEFLKIPQFKIDSGRKYCRQSHTSRLSIRKKPSFSPSRALFQQSQQQIDSIKNNQVRNSLSSFTELRKEHKRYLN